MVMSSVYALDMQWTMLSIFMLSSLLCLFRSGGRGEKSNIVSGKSAVERATRDHVLNGLLLSVELWKQLII